MQHQAPLHSNDGTILSNDADKAKALNANFVSIFTLITTGSYPNDTASLIIYVSHPINFSLQSELSALCQAKHTFSSGLFFLFFGEN